MHGPGDNICTSDYKFDNANFWLVGGVEADHSGNVV
jgi:hypothetical protein